MFVCSFQIASKQGEKKLKFVRRYLIPRLIQYVLVTSLGITVIFFIPRLIPGGPVEQIIGTMTAKGVPMDPAAVKETIRIMRELYGLEEGLLKQYVSFWQRLFTGDFGPSLTSFPVPVIKLISRALPWTLGLLLVTTVSSWIMGNISGGLTGYFRWSRKIKILDGIAMLVRPIPHYIFGMLLIILFAYILPVFPFGGGATVGLSISFTWSSVWDILKHAFLPAMSLILLSGAVNHQTMRLIVQSVRDEDYVQYAKIGSVKERIIFVQYAMRNAILPQITMLAMSLGMIFGGALVVEIVFAYPGIGLLLYRSILSSDYNMLMGITTISVIAIATGILIIDLLYPLFDPRIRLK